MFGVSVTDRRSKNCLQNCSRETEGVRPYGRRSRRWKENIKIDPKGTECRV